MALKGDDDYDYKDRLAFLGDYFDYEAALHKNFLINFYPCDNTVEIFDRDMNRIYLKRAACEGIHMNDMFVGNKVRIYGRQIDLTDYADCYTRDRIGKVKEHTFALIKPGVINKLGEIITQIEDRQFQICHMVMCTLSRKEALNFYEFRKGDSFLPFMLEHIVSGPSVALELVGIDCIDRWRKEIGPRDPAEARTSAPESLRALYGSELASNGFHGADDHEKAVRSACIFFPKGIDAKPPPSTAQINNSTLCMIKPHAIKEKKLGPILSAILDNPKFKITAMQMIYMSTPNADEFLEVYKGVVSDFHAFMLSYLDGPLVALEISTKIDGVNTHEEFRKFAGPSDSDIARQIRPNTLRGMFGVSKYKNAVHCTDLPEDTQLELEYIFKILRD
ncbi:hypothetical protein RI129_002104 [Pyrocoelia pectoralis]|uniref:DM10 domain-containing protein n=1 Tax=Pyrocoelia pectoralis TaxID=417401 RepID=A0AAN7ZLS6_9COLE